MATWTSPCSDAPARGVKEEEKEREPVRSAGPKERAAEAGGHRPPPGETEVRASPVGSPEEVLLSKQLRPAQRHNDLLREPAVAVTGSVTTGMAWGPRRAGRGPESTWLPDSGRKRALNTGGPEITAVRTFRPECPEDRSSAEAHPRKRVEGSSWPQAGADWLLPPDLEAQLPRASAAALRGVCGPAHCLSCGSGWAALSLTLTPDLEGHPELAPSPPRGSSLSPEEAVAPKPPGQHPLWPWLGGQRPDTPELCRVLVSSPFLTKEGGVCTLAS